MLELERCWAQAADAKTNKGLSIFYEMLLVGVVSRTNAQDMRTALSYSDEHPPSEGAQ